MILLSQLLYFTPQLVLIGKHVIAQAIPVADENWKEARKQIHENILKQVKDKPRPSAKLHIVYVWQELIKVVLLGKLIWRCRV